MSKRDKVIEYYDYLVKTHPYKSVEIKFYIRVYDDNMVEASCQPFILDKECIYMMAEYVIRGSNLENIQLYFNNDGDTFEFAPFENGQIIIDLRQAWAGYSGRGHYDCSFNYKGLNLVYNGNPQIDFLDFYKIFLDYAKLVTCCTTQTEVDFLKKCIEKDMKVEELNKDCIAKDARIKRLEEELETQKDLLLELRKLLGIQ